MHESEPLSVDTTPDPDLMVDTDGKFELPTYDIDPADKPIADRILAMHPFRDVPSPFSGFDTVKEPVLSLSSLPPEMREEVQAQLAQIPIQKREGAEAILVRRRLEHNSEQVRSRAGVGDGALPLHKEAADIATEVRWLDREFNTIIGQLTDVDRYDVQIDPKTNERIPVPVYSYEGSERERLVRRQEEINHRIGLLEGIEGERRMKKALLESVELVKQREAQLAEEAAIQAGAEAKVREDRLAKRIAARARSLDPNVG